MRRETWARPLRVGAAVTVGLLIGDFFRHDADFMLQHLPMRVAVMALIVAMVIGFRGYREHQKRLFR